MLLAWAWTVCQCSVFIVNVCVQVDTMEMMRHPEETTNMRRQTVASYFRVGFFSFLLLSCLTATGVWTSPLCDTNGSMFVFFSEITSELLIKQRRAQNSAYVNIMSSFWKITLLDNISLNPNWWYWLDHVFLLMGNFSLMNFKWIYLDACRLNTLGWCMKWSVNTF